MTEDLGWIETGFISAPFMARHQCRVNVSKSREMVDTFHFEVLNNTCAFGAEVRDGVRSIKRVLW